MFKLLTRAWRYLTAALTGKFNEVADPKVQLEQAITDAVTNAPPRTTARGFGPGLKEAHA